MNNEKINNRAFVIRMPEQLVHDIEEVAKDTTLRPSTWARMQLKKAVDSAKRQKKINQYPNDRGGV